MKEHEIETKRLFLYPSVEERDLDIYLAHLCADKEEFYLQCGELYSEELVQAMDFHSTGVIYYSVFLKNTNNLIGNVGIFPSEKSQENGTLEFYIFPEYRRRGYGKEAVLAMINDFFEGNIRGIKGKIILAETMKKNKASQQFLEAIGAKRISTGWKQSYDDNGEANLICLCYYKIDSETIRSMGT